MGVKETYCDKPTDMCENVGCNEFLQCMEFCLCIDHLSCLLVCVG